MKKFFIIFLFIIFLIFIPSCKYQKNKLKIDIIIDSWLVYYDKNELKGFSIELTNLICLKLKKKCEFNIKKYNDIINSIENNISDLALNFNKTDKLNKKFIFSKEYLETKLTLISYEDNFINGFLYDHNEDGKIIFGSTYFSLENEILEDFFKNIKILYFSNIEQKFNAFRLKEINTLIDHNEVIKRFINDFHLKDFLIININKQINGFSFMSNRNNFELIEKINKILEEFEFNGTLNELKIKYKIDI